MMSPTPFPIIDAVFVWFICVCVAFGGRRILRMGTDFGSVVRDASLATVIAIVLFIMAQIVAL